MTATEPLIGAAEVAYRLGVSRRTVLRLAAQGHLPCVRAGPKTVRFDWAAVVRYLRMDGPEGEPPAEGAAP